MINSQDLDSSGTNVVEKTFHQLTKDISIQKKLIGGAVLISAGLLLLLIFVLAEFSGLNSGFDRVLEEAETGVQSATETATKIEDTNLRLKTLMSR